MPQLTYSEKCQKMSDLINHTFLKWQLERGRPISQAEFAKHLGIPATTLSPIITGQRLPRGENIHKLAAVVGPEVYDILDEPRRMPDDPELYLLVDRWYDLSKDQQSAILEIIGK